MKMKNSLTLLYTTVGTQAAARKLAKSLVQMRAAVCVNIVPGVESYFEWEGRIKPAREWILLCKVATPRADKLFRAVQAEHPYDVPCIWMLRMDKTDERFLAWAQER